MTPAVISPEEVLARFPVNLALPDALQSLVKDAAEAVKQEYANSIRWKRLRCRGVVPLTTEPGETIFIIEVGHSIQFDWTWEGAVAFRPHELSEFRGDADVSDDLLLGTNDEVEENSRTVWAGEVVEVDETNGRIFVSVPSSEHPPRTGAFFVRPFQFLAFLNAVYSQEEFSALRSLLPARLEACRGNIHPPISSPFKGGLPALDNLWAHSWGLLWGPPGTGKTHTIGKQVASCLADASERILVVSTTNRATDTAALSMDTIEDAWQAESTGAQFPWERVSLCHIKDLLEALLPEVGLRLTAFDYDSAAGKYLERRPFETIKARCHAMFIDEAQDMGPSTLKLLSALVEQTDPDNPKSRSINIFYDNAQNVYGRGTPTWSEIGLDLRGRSTVMKESFRSTIPITEFALNVLYKLQPPDADADHKELVERGLIERSKRGGMDWWNVRFNQIDGPLPLFNKYASLDQQVSAIRKQVFRWINDEGVRPRDICILANDKYHGERIAEEVSGGLRKVGATCVFQAGQAFDPDDHSVIVSTAQSFKGYDAEVVVIGGVERFIGQGKILANNLYVAMTRARSILAVFAYVKKSASDKAKKILTVIEQSLDQFVDRPTVEKEISNLDEFEEVLLRTGTEHRVWLEKIWKNHWIEQEPILSLDGEILAEPLFWFKEDERHFACFGNQPPGNYARRKLEDAGIAMAIPGEQR